MERINSKNKTKENARNQRQCNRVEECLWCLSRLDMDMEKKSMSLNIGQ